jgi:DNA-binding transcriptional LysR family regulator
MNILATRLGDFLILNDLVRYASINAVARAKKIQPSTVSKIVARLEQQLGEKLIVRSKSGVILTAQGLKILETISPLIENTLSIVNRRNGDRKRKVPVYTIGSPALVNQKLIPKSVEKFRASYGMAHFRTIQVPPGEVSVAAVGGPFDFLIHWETTRLPKNWQSRTFGTLKYDLYADIGHPLPDSALEREILKYPFITPLYWLRQNLFGESDRCPVSLGSRMDGDQTDVAEIAAQLLVGTQQLAYLPEPVASELQRAGKIKKIVCREWPKIEFKMVLSAHIDRVSQKAFAAMYGVLLSSFQ